MQGRGNSGHYPVRIRISAFKTEEVTSMDFLTNLVSVGAFLIVVMFVLISTLISVVIGHMIGDKWDQSYLGGFIGLIFWLWILVSFITSDEFMAWWSGLI